MAISILNDALRDMGQVHCVICEIGHFLVVYTICSWDQWQFKALLNHVNSTWWCHQMETFSALLAICAGNSPVPVNSPHKGQWRGALMFPLICARINDWVYNREAGDLRHHRGHYGISVMIGYRYHQKPKGLSCKIMIHFKSTLFGDAKLHYHHCRTEYLCLPMKNSFYCLPHICTISIYTNFHIFCFDFITFVVNISDIIHNMNYIRCPYNNMFIIYNDTLGCLGLL